MFRRLLLTAIVMSTANAYAACDAPLLDQTFKSLNSDEEINLCESYEDRVVLVVNTASKCGNTPQYDGLENLYEEYGERGLVVLGFPSNDFAGQEPGTEAEIAEFCRLTYGVKFPMFEKIVVKGDDAHPFYQALAKLADTQPRWNFHKFLIGRDGKFIRDFSPSTQPEDKTVIASIEAALGSEAG
ncbi:MAG: glutathione peroxidase [Pseudomonadota bacterium]